jgi:hypothetical protein
MTRNFIRSATCATLLLFGASVAIAQEFANLGELLDKGGKRLDAAELKALLTGATTTGKVFAPGSQLESETTFTKDGKASLRLWGMHPEVTPNMNGTWTINEQGQVCIDMVPIDPRVRPVKGCASYYSVNNVYYAAASDERSAVVRMRKITR